MTAHAVSSPSVAPLASKGTAKSTPADSTATPFEDQLHAARRQHDAATPERAPTHEARPQRGPDAARDRQRDPSALGPQAGHPPADGDRVGKGGVTDPNQAATAPTAASPASPAANPAAATASAAATAAPAGAVLAAAAAAGTATTETSTDGGESGASALVGAMLAMIGPAIGKVLAPAATPAGKPAAAGVGATTALAVADAASAVTSGASASVSLSMPLLADERPKTELTDLRASAATDAALAHPLAALATPVTGLPTTPICVPIMAPAGTPAFTHELGQQIAWFVSHDIQQARIRLHPEELGSLDLKISVDHGRVDVSFQAQHPGAVTALQQSLPQLGQMLAQHGLSLGHAEVGQQHDRSGHRGQASADGDATEMAEIHGASLVTPLGQSGLLDAFA